MGRSAGRLGQIVLLIVASTLGLAPGSFAAIQFQKIAGTGTPLPTGGGNFVHFSGPKIDGDNIVFQESDDAGFTGIYSRFGNAALATIADRNTPAPGGGSFNFLGDAQLDGQTVAFADDMFSVHRAIYLKGPAGPITIAVNQNTPSPTGGGNFNAFIPGSVRLKNGNLAFIGGAPGGVTGVYTKIGGVFARVADTNTTIPGTLLLSKYGYFLSQSIGFDGQSVSFSGGVAQGGAFNDRAGIHTNLGGSLHVIANRTTPVPGGGGLINFEDFSETQILSGGKLYFRGLASPTYDGLYQNTGPGAYTLVGGINTPGPAGSVFTEWAGSINDAGNLLASGIDSSSPQAAYYARIDGQWSTVIRQHDILDGKEIIGFDGADLSGHTVVFAVTFSDLTGGVYTVTVPEPSILGAVAIAALPLRRRRWKNGDP
jgi:hypothetical protein